MAGHIPYNEFVEKLSGENTLGDFLISGIQDMVLFGYMTKGAKEAGASSEDSRSGTPRLRSRACRQR